MDPEENQIQIQMFMRINILKESNFSGKASILPQQVHNCALDVKVQRKKHHYLQ